MNKKLLIAGDSYSTRWWKYNESRMDPKDIPKIDRLWGDIVSDVLKLNLTDYLPIKGGVSNDWIVDKTVPYIIDHHQEIECVLVLWTDFFRFTLHNSRIQHSFCTCAANHVKDLILKNKNHTSEFLSDVVADRIRFADFAQQQYLLPIHKANPEEIVECVVRRAVIHQFKFLEMICKKYNIQYYFMQGAYAASPLCRQESENEHSPSCLLRMTEEKMIQSLLKYQSYIDTSKFIGWPLYKNKKIDENIKGFSFDSMTFNKVEYHVSERDKHPSQLGHELIAETFLERLT